MEERKHIVILAAGDFPTHAVPLAALCEAHFVVCCDSAYRRWEKARSAWGTHTPFIVIGDGDSLPAEDKHALGAQYIQVDEQDYNDLHKAMDWATREFPISNSQFSILGATGRREDHTLGNISYLVTFAEEHPGADIRMLTDHGLFLAFRGERTFATFPRQQISIFTPDPATSVTSQGLRWPLDAMHPRLWWQATLNESLGDSFSLHSDGWVILFRTYDPKTVSAAPIPPCSAWI